MSSTPGFVRVEALSRRAALRRIALGVTAAGLAESLSAADGAEVHAQVEDERTFRGEYEVKYFSDHEFATLERLSELIIPADERGPSGRDGGAPEFMDLLSSQNEELADVLSGGILWLDATSRARNSKTFAAAPEEAQIQILDDLVEAERVRDGSDTRWPSREYARFSVFGVRRPSDVQSGLAFFGWVRRLIVDAYYTSPAGIKDLGFLGNASHTEYAVPQEAIDYAVDRSPFREI